MLSRTKSFHKSTPSLLDSGNRNAHFTYGRDELVENYLNLRDEHHDLRKEANRAKNEIRLLQVKLNRLIEEKKRHFRMHKTDREISLEEIVYDLEHRMQQQNRQNAHLKQRLHLMQIDGQKMRTTTTTTMTTLKQNRRISSANLVQSRNDSCSRNSSSQRPLSSMIVNRKHISFESTEMSEAKTLLAEAKNEILRLECLAEEQQDLLESLLKQNQKPTSEYSSQSTYKLMTTTTVSENESLNTSQDRTNLDQLLGQYQKIMLQSEASNRIESEVRALIESLHNALQEEQHTSAKLRNELNTTTVSASGITEKDHQIETLRKENTILQESIQDCMEKCMALVNGPEASLTEAKNDDSAIRALKNRLEEMESELSSNKQEYSVLIEKYSKLQQLNDNDQLRVKHLEEKIDRLTRLVFEQELDSEIETAEPETISAQLDQLLNSIVKN